MKINVVYNENIPDYNKSLTIIETSLKKCGADFKSIKLDKMEFYGDFIIV